MGYWEKLLHRNGVQALEPGAQGSGGFSVCGGSHKMCELLLDTWFSGEPGCAGFRAELHDLTGPVQQLFDGMIP